MQEKLDSYSKQKLTKAYMHLYDTLVSEYQSKHMTSGQSWYNAMHAIYKILDVTRQKSSGEAMNFLLDLYNSHQQTQTKKMMVSDKKDDVVDIQNTPQIENAIVKLNQALHSCEATDILCTVPHATPKITGPKTFDNWLDTMPEKDVQALENDPVAFEKFYRKYVYQRRQK